MVRKVLITEEEKNNISDQYNDIDRSILNFLLRRLEKKERQIGEDPPMNVIEISFKGLPGYGFNNFHGRKSMEKKVIDMLTDKEVIDLGEYSPNILDVNRQKMVKTVRNFLNFIMPKR